MPKSVLGLFFVLLFSFAFAVLGAPGRAGAAVCTSLGAVPAASTTIQIGEVEADPVLAGTDTANEWFELRNVSAAAVVLSGWTVADSTGSDPIPTVTLGAGQCVVVAATTAGFQSEHPSFGGTVVGIADGAIGNGLSNSGDTLAIADGASSVDCVVWGAGAGCFAPAVAAPPANTTDTLQRTSPTDTDTAADWGAAAETPCTGGATAVKLSSFRGVLGARARVLLTWRTESELDHLGFNVLRSRSRTGGYRKVNAWLIVARGASAGGAAYRFTDRARGPGPLFYRLELIDARGRRTWAGPIRVR